MSSQYSRNDHEKNDNSTPLKHVYPRLHFTYTERQKNLKDKGKLRKQAEHLPSPKQEPDQNLRSTSTQSSETTQRNLHWKNDAISPLVVRTPEKLAVQQTSKVHQSAEITVPPVNFDGESLYKRSTLYSTRKTVDDTQSQYETTRKISPADVDETTRLSSVKAEPVGSKWKIIDTVGSSLAKLSSSTARSFYNLLPNGNEKPPTNDYSDEVRNSAPTLEKLNITKTPKNEMMETQRDPRNTVTQETRATFLDPSPKTLPDIYQQKKPNNSQIQKRWQTVNFDTSQENRVAAERASIMVAQANKKMDIIKRKEEKAVLERKPFFVADNRTTNGTEDEEFKTFLKNIEERKQSYAEYSKNWEGALVGRQTNNVQSATNLTEPMSQNNKNYFEHLYYEETDIPFFENNNAELIEFATKLVDDIFSDLENTDFFSYIVSHRLETTNKYQVNNYDEDYEPFRIVATLSEDAKQFFTPRNSVE